MRGASWEDWALFAEPAQLSSFLYWYDGADDELRLVVVEWPIVWLLVRHNPKHIFFSTRGIDLQSVGDRVRQFEHKLRWMWFHRDVVSRPSLLKYKGTTPRSTGESCPSLDACLSTIRKAVLTYTHRANTTVKARPCSNALGLTKSAWEILRQKHDHFFARKRTRVHSDDRW